MITCLNGARSAAGQVAKRREKGVLPISLPHCVRSRDGKRGRRRGKGNAIGTQQSRQAKISLCIAFEQSNV